MGYVSPWKCTRGNMMVMRDDFLPESALRIELNNCKKSVIGTIALITSLGSSAASATDYKICSTDIDECSQSVSSDGMNELSSDKEPTWYDPRNERIFDTSRNSYLPARAELYLQKAISNKNVVCVGEVHSNPCHHKLEFDVIKSLNLLVPSSNLAIGLECFYRQHQRALDRYVFVHQNFGLLKKETNWDQTWGFDINNYAKIFHFAAVRGIRLVGLNMPIQIAKLVIEKGLENIPQSLLELLPEVDLSDRTHRSQFYRTIQNMHHETDPLRLDRMYQVQTLWDEYMAESTSNFIEHSPKDTIICVIAGVGHISGRTGIPKRIFRRLRTDPFVIVPHQVSWSPESGLPDIMAPPSISECDWAWYTEKEIGYA